MVLKMASGSQLSQVIGCSVYLTPRDGLPRRQKNDVQQTDGKYPKVSGLTCAPDPQCYRAFKTGFIDGDDLPLKTETEFHRFRSQ